MMRSIVRSALIATLAVGGLGLVQCVRAETNAPEAKVNATEKEHRGEIVSVDLKANTITIKHEHKDFVFKLTPDTKITGDGKKSLTPADLKAGDHVNIHYTGGGANMVATHIGHVSAEGQSTEKK